MKHITLFFLVFALSFSLCSCKGVTLDASTHSHEWNPGGCTDRRTCKICGAIADPLPDHNYMPNGKCNQCDDISFNNISFSSDGIEQFLEIVCKNIDGEYARILDLDYISHPQNSNYSTIIEVKNREKVAENVEMCFYNSYASDCVSFATVRFHSFKTGSFSYVDYGNIYECEKAFVMALEKTLAGATYAEEYLTTFRNVSQQVHSPESGDEVIIASYSLTNKLKVTISAINYGWDGFLYYSVEGIPA